MTPLKRSDKLAAALLFLLVTAVTLVAAPSQGIHRDEAYYMDAGEQYITYWERVLTGQEKRPFSDGTIRRYWSYNSEHPPLMKLVYGLSWRLLHKCDCARDKGWHPAGARLESGRHVTLPLFSESTAFRLPTMATLGLLAAIVYLFFIQLLGELPWARVGALAAALLTAAQPRAFFHAQTASFDLPAAFFWVASTYAYFRAVHSRKLGSALALGAVYGLFLATKLQSFFLPIALGAHWLWLGLRARRQGARWPSPAPLISMATVGPLVLVGLWPWLWHQAPSRLAEYLRFHWTHVHYNFEYLGRNFNTPPYPWHEPLGMLITTAPVMLLVLALAGILLLAFRKATPRVGARSLLLLSGLLPISLFFRGDVPIFGETKHWLATMAFLAIAAGVAVARLSLRLVEECRVGRRGRAFLLGALVVVVTAPSVVETVRSHPHGLSHYNALAGGAPGGADLGMNRQFWGYSIVGLLPWFNTHLPEAARLYLHDWNHDAYEIYLREGRLRSDILDAGMEDPGVRSSDAALVIHEKHFNKYEYMIWNAFGHLQPAEVLTLDGVPLVTVYKRQPPRSP
ncbi:MAG: glycosyltransferase family 39 protein [Deltaproteobacteria bacterium]|nr:glycosyltransferase family 39 protein [Deltaproteobacteria bacterium]